jgi:hypothetical protein
MIDSKYISMMQKIYGRLNDTKILWAVTGSLGFALHGMPVEVHDIDIQTDKIGAYDIEDLFKEYVIENVKFSSSEKICSHFGALMIDDIKVEIMGDIQKRLEDNTWEDPVDLIKQRRIIEFEGMTVPVLPLEHEYQAYLKLGRVEKAQRIKNYLDKKCIG